MAWLTFLRIYLAVTTIGNFVWEILQLPLYTIWKDGTVQGKISALLHCTTGDFLISLVALTLALVTVGHPEWPSKRFREVACVTVIAGVVYTIFSEWLNVTVQTAWSYSEWMPIVPIGELRIGLSPLLQWIVVPVAGLAFGRRMVRS